MNLVKVCLHQPSSLPALAELLLLAVKHDHGMQCHIRDCCMSGIGISAGPSIITPMHDIQS